jgi:uncharacterized phiE125 gp8 family phage protein
MIIELKIKTAPSVYPLSLADAKEHLYIDSGNTDHDDYIEAIIKVATADAEAYTRRRFISQTWYAYLPDWPDEDYFVLPYGQLQSVTSITYKDTDGIASTLSTSEYIVESGSDPGKIVLAYDKSWPTDTLYPSNPITVEYVCGYGDAGSDVPDAIIHALKLRVSDIFEHRESEMEGIATVNTKAFERLLWPYRIFY